MGAHYSSEQKISEEVLQQEWAILLKGSDSDWKLAAVNFNASAHPANIPIVVHLIASSLSSSEQEVLRILNYLPTAITHQRRITGTDSILLSLVNILLNANPNPKMTCKVIQTFKDITMLHSSNTEYIKTIVKLLHEAGVLDPLIVLMGQNKNLLTLTEYLIGSPQFCKCIVAFSQTLHQIFIWAQDNQTYQNIVCYACSIDECCVELVNQGVLESISHWQDDRTTIYALGCLHKHKDLHTSNAKLNWLIFQTSMRCLLRGRVVDMGPLNALLNDSDLRSQLRNAGAIEFILALMKNYKFNYGGKVLEELCDGKVSAMYEAIQKAGVSFEHLPDDIAKKIYTFVHTSALNNIRDENAPWYIDPALLLAPKEVNKKYSIIPGMPKDIAFVAGLLANNPVPGYDLKSVQIVSSDHLSVMFTGRTALLEARHKNKVFQPTWEFCTIDTQELAQRKQISEMLTELAKPYHYERTPGVKYVPLWHGTNPAVLDSVLTTGFANLAKTDAGFFGKGLYSTVEAEYAHRVYSAGTLLLNWVAYYSAYPVIAKDEEILSEKGNFENYDAHFVPVYSPRHPKTSNYHACKVGEKHQYTEMVVFESSQMLPHFIVELQPALPRSPPLSIILSAEATTNPSANANENNVEISNRKPTPNSNVISAQAAKNDSNLQAKPVNEWTVDEVCAWVSTLDLSQSYTNELKANHINGKVLKSMIKIDWQDIGVTKFGDIRNLILDVAKLL